jgi:hypothetical protein
MIKNSAARNASGEEWRKVVGYENEYEVSNWGKVRSLYPKTRVGDKENKTLKQKSDNKGYYRVNLYKGGEFKKSALVSRLVAMAFIPNPLDLPQVGHKDDNNKNNNVSNLYWTDSKENNNHNGKMDRFQKLHREKIDIIARKLSVAVVGTSVETGEKIFFSSMQEAKRAGFDSGKISMCVNGKRNSHKKYKWERSK